TFSGDLCFAQHLPQAVNDRLRVIVGGGGHLGGVDATVRAEQHYVGEGAADVDTDAVRRRHHPDFARSVGAGSSRSTFGISHHPRSERISARRFAVATASTRQAFVSITTP